MEKQQKVTLSRKELKKLRRKIHAAEHEEMWRQIRRIQKVLEAMAFHEELVREERSRRDLASETLSGFLRNDDVER